jgi:hypothetical protein
MLINNTSSPGSGLSSMLASSAGVSVSTGATFSELAIYHYGFKYLIRRRGGRTWPGYPQIRRILGKSGNLFHWPLIGVGLTGGLCFDVLAKILHRKLPVSSIRVKKFCANTMFESVNIKTTRFKDPVSLVEGLEWTITYEFVNRIADQVFYTE